MHKPQALLLAISCAAVSSWVAAQVPSFDPHGDPETGAQRVVTVPSTRGQCVQCHPAHGDPAAPQPDVLFTRNDNDLCFTCHRQRPDNYPLGEDDRLPASEPDAGYFEANLGGTRQVGVQFRGRWPGDTTWRDPSTTLDGRYVSPHAHDPDMPRRDAGGEGLCLVCHDPHASTNPHDLLRASYGGIGGHADTGAPARYRLCLQCHGADGPSGMDGANRYIEDWYDAGLNGDQAGHQIRMNPAVALSWPAHVQVGDMLPCYDCHNPHGSRGHDGVRPNGFLISDERSEWSGLEATLTDPAQARNFCFACHIAGDGIPGTQVVEGIVMNTISMRPGHASSDLESCHDCHGRDYSGPTAHNVHNPASGADAGGFDAGFDPWRR